MPALQVHVAQTVASAGSAAALADLARQLGPGPFALVLLFISPEADLQDLALRSETAFPAALVAGCTTSGEVSARGYQSGTIVAIGFPARHFAAETLVFPNLSRRLGGDLAKSMLAARRRLAEGSGDLPTEFAILLVDGLSIREDELASALSAGAAGMPLIGGSAGDGSRFEETFVLSAGALCRDAAVVCVLRGNCDLRPFSLDHLVPTQIRMVVTEADPETRRVRRINAEPAAQEYARLLGRDPAQLDAAVFAANPPVVRMGDRHHVRSIQRIGAEGELVFYSAIDEGVILSLARPQDLVGHLETGLADLSRQAAPVAILAFDCILRRIEAEQTQQAGRLAQVLRGHPIIGFNTYGEQVGPMHLNQTISGMAFYQRGSLPVDAA